MPESQPDQPLSFSEAVTELDTANMELYHAAARYADVPRITRFNDVANLLQASETSMKDCLLLAVEQSEQRDIIIRQCIGLIAAEDKTRSDCLQQIILAKGFPAPSPSFETLLEMFDGVHLIDCEPEDLANALLYKRDELLVYDFERFFTFVNKSPQGRAFRFGRRVAPFAIEGARLGAAVGVSLLLTRKFSATPGNS